MQTLQKGDKAPDFELLDQDENKLSLNSFIGKKVLLYFYPKASTPGCTTQACGLRDNLSKFNDLDIVVLGISPDAPKKLLKFKQDQNLNFPLISDIDHQLADKFGVWGEKKFMGRTYFGVHRISFLIDEQGFIAQVFNDFKPANHHKVVLDYLTREA